MSTLSNGQLSVLTSALPGRVILPDDTAYDTTRALFYSWLQKQPAAIVKAQNADDVIAAVNFARDHGLELAVRGGGHSYAGHSATEGGLLLDMSALSSMEIDAPGRTTWAGAGMTAGKYTVLAAERGLATGFGDTGSVGIGGITLGGGVGYLVRKHGLTIDSLLGAEIVTADGKLLSIDEEHYPDLFWAIRGGGGNFGVVTRFKYRLHPLEQIVGGMLILPATAETISDFMQAAEAAPDELSTIANVMPAPPMPFLPAELHGKLIIFAMMVYAGDPQQGEQVLAPFRKLATPLADMMGPKKYPEIYAGEDGPHPTAAVARTMFMDHIGRKEAQLILDRIQSILSPLRVAQLRVLGGAMARVPVMATAYAHRKSRIMVNVAALFENMDESPVYETWANETAGALLQDDQGVYVNFLGEEGEARLRAAYPGFTWQRLAEIKRRYDPANLFHRNHNIRPA